jgi:hypothetical protein
MRRVGRSDRNWEFGIEHLSDLTNVQFSMLNSYPEAAAIAPSVKGDWPHFRRPPTDCYSTCAGIPVFVFTYSAIDSNLERGTLRTQLLAGGPFSE